MPPKKKASSATATSRSALQTLPQNSNGKRTLDKESQDAAPKPKRTSTRATSSTSASTTPSAPLEVIEEQPVWAFDVVGTWTIDATTLSHDLYWFRHEFPKGSPFVLELKYTNNPSHKKIGRQLWGTFKWGNMEGCMRLCPGHGYTLNHDQFHKKCVLKKGVWAGDEPEGTSTWNFRWRAKDDGILLDGSDEWETQLEFFKSGDGTMMMMGKMVMGGYKARKFAGLRTGELKSAPNKNEKTVDGWWKALRDPGEESSLELSRVCKGRMEDSSEDETDTEWGKKWEEHKKEREAEEAKEKLEEAQPWPTGMAGEWAIDLRQSSKDTEAGSMTIHGDTNSDGSIRQYWTEFQFGDNWRGMMRLCPMGSFEEDSEIKVEDFEKACILKEGVEAGPPPGNVNQWLMKWRGSLVEKYLPDSMRKDEPRDNMTTSITFKCGEDGRLSLSGVLLEGCIFRLFEGVRVGDGTPREPSAPKLEMLWNDKKFKEPRPPALWPWRSPIPSECVESPPAWAWDVIGKWKIDAPEVAASLEAKKNDPFTMEIHMANSKKPVSLGRQLWATFKVGPKVLGCMRFIPLPEDSRPMDTVPAFEKACKLKKNIWPGHERSAPGKSYHKWGLRWRAKRTTGKSDYGRSDLYETMFNFERDEDGTLRVSGVWTIDSQMQLWKGVKIEDGPQVDGTETTVNAVWKSFAAK